jgi:hypothetical protein
VAPSTVTVADHDGGAVHRHCDRCPPVTVGVADQVREDPVQPPRIGTYRPGIPRRHTHRQPGAPYRILDEIAERNGHRISVFHARVQSRHLQQFLDQRMQHPDPVPHQIGHLAPRQQFRQGDQSHQRGSQIVRHIGSEPLLAAQPPLQAARHLIHGH